MAWSFGGTGWDVDSQAANSVTEASEASLAKYSVLMGPPPYNEQAVLAAVAVTPLEVTVACHAV